ncbi:MAG TPA: presenilin family intramembrane aspartyl protease [Candidatus Paceibacterota bacterium]|nr:presenilin family intramembrane aspartyl protease [Candidatus Paceibacterota bacterium]
MKLRSEILLKELLLFFLTLGSAIFVAYRTVFNFNKERAVVQPIEFSWATILVFIGSFAILSLIMSRFPKLAGVILRIFFLLIIFAGIQISLASILPVPWDLLLALGIIAIMYLWPSVGIHNFAIILSLAGIAAILGLSITPLIGLFILVGLSAYDIIAVYWTGHMVKMAKAMVSSGSVFGFLIPQRWEGFLARRSNIKIGEELMILGSGDVALPAIFASSLVSRSLIDALVVTLFAAGGLFITHLLFVNQPQRRAMAALPPIATMSIIGYAITLLL